ncbi:MAG TPA: hypothetical protein VI320_02475 [Terracidiphilus sp.]
MAAFEVTTEDFANGDENTELSDEETVLAALDGTADQKHGPRSAHCPR